MYFFTRNKVSPEDRVFLAPSMGKDWRGWAIAQIYLFFVAAGVSSCHSKRRIEMSEETPDTTGI